MANNYFNDDGKPSFRGVLSSLDIRKAFAAISRAFDKLPPATDSEKPGFSEAVLDTPEINDMAAKGGTWGTLTAPAERIIAKDVIAGAGGALQNTATEGYLFFPQMSGPPTGSPSAPGLSIPAVIDEADDRLYVKIGGTWKSVQFT